MGREIQQTILCLCPKLTISRLKGTYHLLAGMPTITHHAHTCAKGLQSLKSGSFSNLQCILPQVKQEFNPHSLYCSHTDRQFQILMGKLRGSSTASFLWDWYCLILTCLSLSSKTSIYREDSIDCLPGSSYDYENMS